LVSLPSDPFTAEEKHNDVFASHGFAGVRRADVAAVASLDRRNIPKRSLYLLLSAQAGAKFIGILSADRAARQSNGRASGSSN